MRILVIIFVELTVFSSDSFFSANRPLVSLIIVDCEFNITRNHFVSDSNAVKLYCQFDWDARSF